MQGMTAAEEFKRMCDSHFDELMTLKMPSVLAGIESPFSWTSTVTREGEVETNDSHTRLRNIKFQRPVFEPGICVTVRKDDPRFRAMKPGELVAMTMGKSDAGSLLSFGVGEGEVFGFMRIHAVHVYFLHQIPEDLLAKNHDPIARDREGLLRVLGEFYGRPPETSVVVIEFEPYLRHYEFLGATEEVAAPETTTVWGGA